MGNSSYHNEPVQYNEVLEADAPQYTSEDEILASFGYKQEMHKTMSTISNFAIAFGCCSILSGLTPMWGDAMMSGGSIAVIWGWIIVSVFTFGVGLSLAEICSAYPVTGGLYIWVSRLAPPEWVPIMCWLTGWCNWLGLTVAITSADLGLAQFMSSVIGIKDPNYNAGIYWQYGIFLVVLFIHGVINSMHVKYNGFFNQTSLYWHLVGTLLIIVVALVLTPNKPSAKWVFTYFENDTGFSSNSYAFLIGLLQSQYTLSGFDSAAQMSEETRDAARAAPLGILYAIGTAAITGFVFILSVNFCVQDFQVQVVETTLSPQMTQVFLDGAGYKWTVVFTVIIMGAMFFSGSALTLGSSRMIYAFARDGATPFSRWLSVINRSTQTPIYAVWANIIFAAVVGLLYILNETAFNAIVSINTIASSLAYFIPIALRLTVARKSFRRGPFHMGPFSDLVNFTSCIWILFTSILFICPTKYPVTADNMNYSSVIFVGVMLWSIAYYHFRARKWFNGPGKSLEQDPPLTVVSYNDSIDSISYVQGQVGSGSSPANCDDTKKGPFATHLG
ncbi:amino acid permease-domain-containing protein [Mycotypha africana]|uniref:amino acid permease-domain-containing protein n=1 Tax=Mycotypha africana TaxID=64632 RepID=UPI002300837F|nr:amino acid permease-domain-containing protein [Mycotypha africana]KAI8975093.1 amino acid permease-domain-containing protein [Mycotypha africana]